MKPHLPITPPPKLARKPQPKTATDRCLMTLDEATALLHCHRVTLLRLIKRGQLHALKNGGRISFERAEVSGLANRNIAVYPHLTIARRPN